MFSGANASTSEAAGYRREPSDGRAQKRRSTGRRCDRAIRWGTNINNYFLWKGAPGRDFGYQRNLGFCNVLWTKWVFGYLINKTCLGLLNQADLDLILRHSFNAILSFALQFLCNLTFWSYKAILPRGRGMYIFFGFLHVIAI